MRHRFALLFAMVIWLPVIVRSDSSLGPSKTPKETIEQLWRLATEGGFLPPEGWNRYSGVFLQRSAPPGNKKIRVVSNHWAILSVSTTDSKSDVTVEFANDGVIDSQLNYTPPPKTPYFKTALIFHLVLAPTHVVMYTSDGHTLTGKNERPGPPAWQISNDKEDPFTTVNTAIRYVLEIREKTNDSDLRKRADATLKKLLELQ